MLILIFPRWVFSVIPGVDSCQLRHSIRIPVSYTHLDVYTRPALHGVYFTMESRNLYGKHLTWGIVDALGQVYNYGKAAGLNEMQFGADEYAWDHYAFKPVLSSIWTEAYNVVANCNNIIQQIEPVSYTHLSNGIT